MFSLKQLVVLALAGTTIAAPLAHRSEDGEHRSGRLDTNQWFNAKSGTPGTYYDYQSGTTVVVVSGSDGSDSTAATGTTTSAPSSSPVASPVASSAPATGASGGTGDYMSIVSKWRAAGGYAPLTQSSKLEANALKTANDGNGKMVHELNPGTMGQVLAPGTASNFEKVYVGGWLCEKPELPGLNGICATMTAGWDHSSGEDGHAKILTSTAYKSIGCALADGIWACDLA